ncbi:MAG: DNA-3-methyladenine glycosylase I [Marinoscillum sp.]|jgi:DNA-3-methyladenine glycosylase I
MDKERCGWAKGTFEQYEKYHDEEWGVPNHDDKRHFEFLILESAQSGLSWSTILKKRDGYRTLFADFDMEKVSLFDDSDVQKRLLDPRIIRNRLKIVAAINNAKRFIEVQKEIGSFDQYIWSFVGNEVKVGHWKSMSEVPATTAESDKLAKDLKKRGFKFLGSKTIYAHMQAMGLVNDHIQGCFRYSELVH